MLASRRSGSTAESAVSLRETLIAAGLTPNLADELEAMPQKVVYIDPRRPFRDSGVPRDEVIFVRSGILSKFKIDGAARRQIVALRFPGEGILPRPGPSSYGIQAIVPSEVLIGSGDDFNRIVDKHPEILLAAHAAQRGDRLRMADQLRATRFNCTRRSPAVRNGGAEPGQRSGRAAAQSIHAAADRRNHRPNLGQRQSRHGRPRAPGIDRTAGPRHPVHGLVGDATGRQLPAGISGLTRQIAKILRWHGGRDRD
jgi:CRP-like cAMP-binding protein